MGIFDSKIEDSVRITMTDDDSNMMESLLRDKLSSQQAYEHAFFVYRDELARLNRLETDLWIRFKSTYELDSTVEYTCIFDQTSNRCVILRKSATDHIFDKLVGNKVRP